jgi:hypothetical protein
MQLLQVESLEQTAKLGKLLAPVLFITTGVSWLLDNMECRIRKKIMMKTCKNLRKIRIIMYSGYNIRINRSIHMS